MSQIERGVQEKTPSWAGRSGSYFFWELLLPRRLSFFSNTLFFSGGLIFTWLEGHRGSSTAVQDGSTFTWTIAFVLCWFLIQEILVQQGKYMWNDIRDHEQDQKIPANRARLVARLEAGDRQIFLLCMGRWAAGVLLATFLAPSLLLVVLAITALQIIYEYWAKPRADKYPLAPLLIVAVGTVFKCMGPALALGWGPADRRWWLYSLALFGTGIVYGSTLWRLEADYFARQGLDNQRGQSAYFRERGMYWLRVGSAMGVIACLFLLVDGFLSRPLCPMRLVSSLLLLFLLLFDYRFNHTTTYREYNLLK
jgi:hypothetical protein